MLRSLHIKLVLIMILLVVCLMTIAGAFLVNSVNRFYLNEFYTQMVEVFSQDTEFIRDLVTAREGETDGVQAIDEILVAKMGPLGVDGKNRNYYLLDGDTGQILSSSDDDAGDTLEEITPNLLIALSGRGTRVTSPPATWTWPCPSAGGRRTMSSISWTSGPPCGS